MLATTLLTRASGRGATITASATTTGCCRYIDTLLWDGGSSSTTGCGSAAVGVHDSRRGMARMRNYYLHGASNKQDISERTKELLKNVRDPEDRRWRLGPGVAEPQIMDPNTIERQRATQYIIKYRGETTNADNVVKYYPMEGEEESDEAPSPVLMVKRVKTLKGEPWFNVQYCEQIGLGKKEKLRKLAFMPNIPSVNLILFKIKHLIEIKPVTFPNGMPDDFNPDTSGFQIKSNGEFIVHPSLKKDPEDAVQSAQWMKLTRDQIQQEGYTHYKTPYNSVVGSSTYHKDSRWRDNTKADSQYVKNLKKKWS